MKKGELESISMQEEQFWKDLLEKYLYPIDDDKAEKVSSKDKDGQVGSNAVVNLSVLEIFFKNYFKVLNFI